MIKDILEIFRNEREIYLPHLQSLKNWIMAIYTHNEEYEIFRFVLYTRISELYFSKNKIIHLFFLRKSSIMGRKLNFFISPGGLGSKTHIYHQGVVINKGSVIGEGCRFHGDNCVGNNGNSSECPSLGNRVEVGIGAKIIGDVTIADDIIIGANSVVTHDFLEPGITIAGIPAKRIKKEQLYE